MQRLAFNLLILGAAACPVAVALPLGDQFALPKLAVALFVAGGVLILTPSALLARRWRAAPLGPLLALGFLLALALATLLADYPLRAIVGTYTAYSGVLYYVAGTVAMLAAVALVRTPARFERLVSFLAVGAVPVLAYALFQAAGLDPFAWDIDFDGRVFSTLGQPLVLGGYLAMLLPLLAWLAYVRRGGERLFLIAETTVAAGLLAETGTRGAWLGATAAALVIGLLLLGRARGPRFAAAALAAVAVGSIALFGTTAITGLMPERLRSTASLNERADLWRASAGMIADKPLFGAGPEHFALDYGRHRPSEERGPQDAYEAAPYVPHNDTLRVAAAVGVPGGLLYLALLSTGAGLAALTFWRRPQRPRGSASLAAAGALTAFMAQAQFSIPDPALFFVAMTLLGSAYALGPQARLRLPALPRIAASIPARAPLVAAGGTLAFAAVMLIAADAIYSRGSSGAVTGDDGAIDRLRIAVVLNPLQPEYHDTLASARSTSAEPGIAGAAERTTLLLQFQTRVGWFGAEARHHLFIAEETSRLVAAIWDPGDDETQHVRRLEDELRRRLSLALAADPRNPGVRDAVREIEARHAAIRSQRGEAAR